MLLCLAVVLLFGTVSALTLPASTMQPQCGFAEHTHIDACYTQVEDGAQETLICTEAHEHNARCYGTWVVACGKAEHTHTEACFPEAAAFSAEQETAMLKISLLYGDEQPQSTYPDGVFSDTTSTMVDFAFVVNGKTASGGSQDGYRDASEVTLTDVLPQYTDKDGATRTAVFDAEENPGRTLADDGMTVSKTYTGANSEDVLVQIYNDALHLRFPGLRFATDSDGNASVNLTNTVRLSAVPSNASEGETRPSAEDDIRFRVTDDPVGRGSFGKVAYKGDIYDVGIYKTSPYPWKIDLSNARPQPLQHIVIQDRKIEENGKTVLEGLDEALKFVRLESHLSLPEGTTAADIVDLVGDNLDEYQGKEGKTADLYDLNNNGRSDDQIAFAYVRNHLQGLQAGEGCAYLRSAGGCDEPDAGDGGGFCGAGRQDPAHPARSGLFLRENAAGSRSPDA